jgi:hypothetical protein
MFEDFRIINRDFLAKNLNFISPLLLRYDLPGRAMAKIKLLF